jgi:dihydroneopterin aldolase
MDHIEIRGLRAFGRHGVYEHERRDGQHFVVDVTLDCDLSRPERTDDLADTVDYGALVARLAAAVEETRFDLLEALAGHLATLVLAEPGVTAATVRVAKPDVALEAETAQVAVVLRRERRG